MFDSATLAPSDVHCFFTYDALFVVVKKAPSSFAGNRRRRIFVRRRRLWRIGLDDEDGVGGRRRDHHALATPA